MTAPRRVSVISPHPDDEAIGCGGTLARHAADGAEVRVIFLTSGEHGGHGAPPAQTAARREAEAHAAAQVLGVAAIEFWRARDGALAASRALVERLREHVERFAPGRLYVTHPGEAHADHRAAARAVRRALAAAPHGAALPEVWLYEIWTPLTRPDEIVDISEHAERKREAIRAYASQCEAMRFDEAALALNRFRGEYHSWPGGDYAEVFARMRP